MTIRTILACLMLSTFAYSAIICKQNQDKTLHSQPKKNKKIKEKVAYPFPGKLVKNMTDDELILTLEYAKKVDDRELAEKVYYSLISQSKSQENLKKYKLDFADYSFSIKNYERALMAYEDFGILYPGSTESEYGKYKAIVCCFMLSLNFDCDQTNTQKTISLCLLFNPKAKDQTLLAESTKIYQTCRKRLFDHELYVFETYLKLLKFKSAKHRLDYIEKEFTDIAHHAEYVSYCKEMLPIFENKKTRPFIIQLNANNALVAKEERKKSTSWRHALPFFLG